MYDREIEKKVKEEASGYPVLAIVGPRQTGKTTLVRKLFPDYTYVLLEDLEVQKLAQEDPKSFFARYTGSLILDEVQKTPELLSYIQGIVDEPNNKQQFILTGSEHLLLSEKISQTLAGRVRLFTLLPLSLKEVPGHSLEDYLFKGGYPRIYKQNLEPQGWLSSYYSTYVEKDIRSVANITNLDSFDRVIRLSAGRVGQLMDYSQISNDAGVSAPTVKSWISVLKATFICFTLQPHFKNFNKRIIKTPKLYFYDTGLLCYLLQIHSIKELVTHPLYGQIFENWIISEKLKSKLNQGLQPNFYFWRDQKGHEVDLIEDQAGILFPIEIKSSKTFHSHFLKNIEYLNDLQSGKKGELIYGGEDSYQFKDIKITSWSAI